MSDDTATIRGRTKRSMMDGLAYVSADDFDGLCSEVDRLRAAITQALGQLNETTRYDPKIEAAIWTLRGALGIPEGP